MKGRAKGEFFNEMPRWAKKIAKGVYFTVNLFLKSPSNKFFLSSFSDSKKKRAENVEGEPVLVELEITIIGFIFHD